jgi:hypothetical protein
MNPFEEYIYEILFGLLPVLIAGFSRVLIGEEVDAQALATEFLMFPLILVVNTTIKALVAIRRPNNPTSRNVPKDVQTLIVVGLVLGLIGLSVMIGSSVTHPVDLRIGFGLIIVSGLFMWPCRVLLKWV